MPRGYTRKSVRNSRGQYERHFSPFDPPLPMGTFPTQAHAHRDMRPFLGFRQQPDGLLLDAALGQNYNHDPAGAAEQARLLGLASMQSQFPLRLPGNQWTDTQLFRPQTPQPLSWPPPPGASRALLEQFYGPLDVPLFVPYGSRR